MVILDPNILFYCEFWDKMFMFIIAFASDFLKDEFNAHFGLCGHGMVVILSTLLL